MLKKVVNSIDGWKGPDCDNEAKYVLTETINSARAVKVVFDKV